MVNQTTLFRELQNRGGWKIITSKLKTRIEKIKIDDRVVNYKELLGKGIKEITHIKAREKGIDVAIATDIIVGAIDKKYDTAILVSSDTDLVPAIDWIRTQRHKRVEYIGFSVPSELPEEVTRPTKALIYRTDVQRVLVESDLKPFIRTLFSRGT